MHVGFGEGMNLSEENAATSATVFVIPSPRLQFKLSIKAMHMIYNIYIYIYIYIYTYKQRTWLLTL